MEKFTASMRRLFGKKENDGVKRKSHPYDEVKVDKEGINVGEHDANEFQIQRQSDPHDSVTVDVKDAKVGEHDANEFQISSKSHPYDDIANEIQKAPERASRIYDDVDLPVNAEPPQRAQRSYEEVDLPVNPGGKIEIR